MYPNPLSQQTPIPVYIHVNNINRTDCATYIQCFCLHVKSFVSVQGVALKRDIMKTENERKTTERKRKDEKEKKKEDEE